MHFEVIGSKISVAVDKVHRFGTDAFLLADFAGYNRHDTVCDLGTGCGIIPLLMCKDPEKTPAKIYGVDIQPEAIELLEQSVAHCKLEGKITPICADLRNSIEGIPNSLTLVTCNPPYKRAGSGILPPNPADQIARHEVMCNADDVCKAAKRLLRFGGRLCICQRPERLADMISAMRGAGIEPRRLRMVSKTPQTEPWLFLLEGVMGGKPFMRILPHLYIEDGENSGIYSEELRNIYGQPE